MSDPISASANRTAGGLSLAFSDICNAIIAAFALLTLIFAVYSFYATEDRVGRERNERLVQGLAEKWSTTCGDILPDDARKNFHLFSNAIEQGAVHGSDIFSAIFTATKSISALKSEYEVTTAIVQDYEPNIPDMKFIALFFEVAEKLEYLTIWELSSGTGKLSGEEIAGRVETLMNLHESCRIGLKIIIPALLRTVSE